MEIYMLFSVKQQCWTHT